MANETGDFGTTLETIESETVASPSVKQGAKDTVASLKAAAGAAKETASAAATHAKETGEAWKEQAGSFAGQALDSARAAASTAKDKTGTALHSLSKLIYDTAETVDGKLGSQYGDYARQAAESVAGAAEALDDKDIDQLVSDARDFVRKSPAVAIGAAALVGFVLMRLARGGGSKEA
jgi:ElaB/YqjD/DUF883 family membrane-anchored ribosome-binding protein